MYNYETKSTRHRTYRPDVLPLITEWLATVPADAWEYFVAFRVGDHGEFVAKFMKQPTRGGPLRLVTYTLDHNKSAITTDCGVWVASKPVSFVLGEFEHAINTF
jgi:hypothetical protein